MAGELYLVEARAGLETVYGTPVAPTRRMYFAPGSMIDPGGSTIRNSVLTGNRAQVLSARPGASAPAGQFSLPLAADEVLEIMLTGLTDTVVVTTPSGTVKLHTNTGPGTALKSMTLQMHDGARPWQVTGVYTDNLRITGEASPEGNNMLAGNIFGNAITQTALTGSVTARNPIPYAGWEATLAIDPVSGADNYGSTVIAAANSVVSWDIPISVNNLGRVYTAANTRNAQAATTGVFEATGRLSFLASGAQALTNYNDFAAGTMKRLRMVFGNNLIIEGAATSMFRWDMQVVWTAVRVTGENGNVRTYECDFGYVFDATNSLGCRTAAQVLNRAAAF